MKNFKKVFKLFSLLLCFGLVMVNMVSCKKLDAKLTLTADKDMVFPGETVQFSTSVDANIEDDFDISYEIVKGNDLASITKGGLLTVSEEFNQGGTVSVVSKLEGFTSNEVSVEIGINVESVTASASKTVLNSGNAVSLNAEVSPSNATNSTVTWEIVEGDEWGVLSGNVLIVNSDVPTDKEIKVKAVAGNVSSNILKFTINPFVLDFNLTLTSDKSKAFVGDVVSFTTQVRTNTEDYDPVTYEIIEGTNLASITNDGKLTINSNNGGKVVVVSKSGKFVSNEIEITVGITAESITASSDNYNITAGSVVTLNSVVSPDAAENKNVTWVITEGDSYGRIVGDVLIINDNIEESSTIKVKATLGLVESNELTFTIVPKVVEVNLVLTSDKQFAYPSEVVTLSTAHNSKDDISSSISYEIIDGNDLATITSDGKLTINSTSTNGGKVVVVSKYNDFVSNEIEINIGIKVSSVTISANKSELSGGNALTLSANILPLNATNKAIQWNILEGSDICEINGNVLILADEVGSTTAIKVQATVDGILSNILEFSVIPDVNDINLILTSDKDFAYPSEVITLTTQVKSNETVEEEPEYVIIEGSNLATITSDGKLTINSAATTGGTVVVVSRIGEFESNEITIEIGIKVSSITLSASKTDVTNGNAVTFTSTITPTNASNQTVTLSILEGEELCELIGNVLIINDYVSEAGVIKVQATADGLLSNIITLNVTPPVVELELELSSTATSAAPSESIQFATSITPTGEYDVEYYIASGSDLATITSDGVLTINSTSTTGGTVVVGSRVGDFTSNLIGVEIIVKVTSVVISAQKNSLLAGNSLVISKQILPTNATNQEVTWIIVEGDTLAHMVGDVFFVNEGTKSGSVIKLQALVDGKLSNILEFTVEKTQEEIYAEQLYISLSSDNITVDRNGSSSPVLSANLYDGNLAEVTNKNVIFEIVSGNEYISLNPSGLDCSFTVLGHGVAVVKASIEGTDVYETTTINAILPPDALEIHEVFTQRSGFNYNFGKSDDLYFPVTAIGTNVCDEYVVTFKDANNNFGNDVAVYDYATNKITFKALGLVTVSVTSTSGSKLEATNSYTFNINEGINVYTYDELQATVGRENGYKGEVVNIVVLEKPTTTAYSYTYGYDLVPSIALLAKEEQSIEDIFNNEASILVYNTSLYLNGNGHNIDCSQVRVLNKSELASLGANSISEQTFSVLHIFPDSDATVPSTFQISIYDLSIKTNTSINFADGSVEGQDLNGVKNLGVYARCINIGSVEFNDRYYVDMKNISLTDAYIGLSLNHIVEGTIENLSVNNCFSNGVQCNASIVTFNNLNIGKCGAAGIEIGPNNCGKAGYNFNEAQKITFAGHITTSNYNDGSTVYMQNYNTGLGVTVVDIINGAINSYDLTTEELSNIRNSNGEFVFVSFIFNDLASQVLNSSIVQYKDIDGAGIINVNDLNGIDTIHKFIEIEVTISGIGSMGKALLYNQNYQGE